MAIKMCNWKFKKIWKEKAGDTQKTFYTELGKNGGYHYIRSPWEAELEENEKNNRYQLLKTKLILGFFGIPLKEEPGYDHLQIMFVENVIDIIHNNCSIANENSEQSSSGVPELQFHDLKTEYLKIAFVIILMRHGRKEIPVPILRFQCDDGGKFIDSEGVLHASWQDFENHLKSSKNGLTRRYCCPKNGVYQEDKNEKLEIYYINGGYLESGLKTVPRIIYPKENILSEFLCVQYCLSELFFFNRFFIDPRQFWKTCQKCIKKALASFKDDLSFSEKIYWENHWGNIIKNKTSRTEAFFCLREIDRGKLINILKKFKIRLDFQKHGLIKIGNEIIINPAQFSQLETGDLEKIKQFIILLKEQPPCFELVLENKDVKFFLEFKINKQKEEICRFLANRCSFSSDDKIRIILNENFEFVEYIRPDQVEKLHRLLKMNKGNCELLRIYFLLIEHFGCSNLGDLIYVIESVNLLKTKLFKEEKTKFDSAEKKERDRKKQLKEQFNKSEFYDGYGIRKGMTPHTYLLEKAIQELSKKVFIHLDRWNWQCLNRIKKYDFRFTSPLATVCHFLKHAQDFGDTVVNPKEYFEKIQSIIEQDPMPQRFIMDGDKVKIVSTLGRSRVCRYEYPRFEPDGSHGTLIIVATCY